ncbi:MAG: hypothetical protein HDR24_00245, partial [Lachnospiraceae bacterium]|nr:hypothetical protein [Lachnospiraceae bacterium]
LSGIAGAIETGTSPMNAVMVFLTGCLVMAAYIRQEGWDVIIGKIEGKEETMSGLEREELTNLAKGMTADEMCTVAGLLPDDVLWGEMRRRFDERSAQVENVRRDIGG